MEWGSWAAFWAMGGKGAYVWGSYGVTALVIVLEVILVLRRRKETVRRLLKLRRVMPATANAPTPTEERI